MTLYSPAKEDFLPEYERDRANGKVQTWDQYWGWVQAFYAGNLLADGWTKHGEQSLAAIKSGESRQDLVERYNELGKIVGRQWAKDYAIRKITTADLRRWHEALTDAVRTDDGTGEKIKKALKKVREQAEKQLATLPRAGGPPSAAPKGDALHAEAAIRSRAAGQDAIDRLNSDRMIARPGFRINRFGPLAPLRRCD
jgi:hypothetical protein